MRKQDLVIELLHSNQDLIIVGDKEEEFNAAIMSPFSLFLDLYVAPRQPVYEPEALQKFMIGIIPETLHSRRDNFSLDRLDFNPKETKTRLRFGRIYIDEGTTRITIGIYPNVEIARDAMEEKILPYEIASDLLESYKAKFKPTS